MSAGTLSKNARTVMTAESIHNLIVNGLWRLNARAERIRGLGLCPALVRVELQDARRELLLLAGQLGEIEPERGAPGERA